VSDAAFSGKGEIRIAAIRGAELVAFLQESQGGETRSIIIESARPPVNAPSRPGGKAITSSREMLPPPAATLGKRRVPKVDDPALVAMEEIGRALKRLGLDGLARRNDLAGAYVVEATAAQIRELAATPGVQAIRLNRRHRNVGKAHTLGGRGPGAQKSLTIDNATRLYKHTGSRVPDFLFAEHFDHEAKVLTITACDFDSAAFADMILRHPEVIAFEG